MDSYFDPNERKYYLTPQSVETVIQEEIQRTTVVPKSSEDFGKPVERMKHALADETGGDDRAIEELERQILDLKITNRGKDQFIELLKSERKETIEKLQATSRLVGQLETKLKELN